MHALKIACGNINNGSNSWLKTRPSDVSRSDHCDWRWMIERFTLVKVNMKIVNITNRMGGTAFRRQCI